MCECLFKFVEWIVTSVMGILAIAMIAVGGAMKAQGDHAIRDAQSELHLSALPVGLIVLGVIILLLVILNCVAICSGDGKCKLLKKILGTFQSVLGLVIIIVGYVEGAKVASWAETSNRSKLCSTFSKWSQGFYLGMSLRAEASNNCAAASNATWTTQWDKLAVGSSTAVADYNNTMFGVSDGKMPAGNSGFGSWQTLQGLEGLCNQFCLDQAVTTFTVAPYSAGKTLLQSQQAPTNIFSAQPATAVAGTDYCVRNSGAANYTSANDCSDYLSTGLNYFAHSLETFCLIVGLIFIIAGISCFCYIHRKKDDDDEYEQQD